MLPDEREGPITRQALIPPSNFFLAPLRAAYLQMQAQTSKCTRCRYCTRVRDIVGGELFREPLMARVLLPPSLTLRDLQLETNWSGFSFFFIPLEWNQPPLTRFCAIEINRTRAIRLEVEEKWKRRTELRIFLRRERNFVYEIIV